MNKSTATAILELGMINFSRSTRVRLQTAIAVTLRTAPELARRALPVLTVATLTITGLSACSTPAAETYDLSSTTTRTVTLTPDAPVADVTFSFSTDRDIPAATSIDYEGAEDGYYEAGYDVGGQRGLTFSFKPPPSTPISITGDLDDVDSALSDNFADASDLTFDSIASEATGVEQTSLSLNDESRGTIQLALPPGATESVEFELTAEVEVVSNFEELAIDFSFEVDNDGGYASNVSTPRVFSDNVVHRQIYISSPDELSGEGLMIENPTFPVEAGEAWLDVDGTLSELPGEKAIIPWPLECLDGPCEAVVDFYTFDDTSKIVITSPDPNAAFAVSVVESATTTASVRLEDVTKEDEQRVIDLDIATTPSAEGWGSHVRFDPVTPSNWDTLLTLSHRETGEVLGQLERSDLSRFDTLLLAIDADGTLPLRIEASADFQFEGEPEQAESFELVFSIASFDSDKPNLSVTSP